jgi:hypothetical protein
LVTTEASCTVYS